MNKRRKPVPEEDRANLKEKQAFKDYLEANRITIVLASKLVGHNYLSMKAKLNEVQACSRAELATWTAKLDKFLSKPRRAA